MGLSDNFSAFQNAVKAGLVDLATGTLKSAAGDVRADGEAFLRDSAENLKRWGDALAQGTLTKDDFEFLLKSQVDLSRMLALAAKGTSKARIGIFKRDLSGLVLKAAFLAIGI
jgi:hypothetical protein